MNKDLEKWLTEANPYRISQFDTNAKHFAWEEGATSMAIHLEAKQREKEDVCFAVGVEYQRKQPPTEDQIRKVLQLYFTNNDIPLIGGWHFRNEEGKKQVDEAVKLIKEKWNNEI